MTRFILSMVEGAGVTGSIMLAAEGWILAGWIIAFLTVALAWTEGAEGWGSTRV